MVLPTPLQAFSGMPKASATTEKQTIVDGEKMTGAEALVRSLEDLGVKDVSVSYTHLTLPTTPYV